MGAARMISHYSSEQDILLVGEGDFSFAASLTVAFELAPRLVATSLDSAKVLRKKYASLVEATLPRIRTSGATVMHKLDATTMANDRRVKERSFDRIVYNFPHVGFQDGLQECAKERIGANVSLMRGFFKNAAHLVRSGSGSGSGEVHVTHHVKHPYTEWDLKGLAAQCGLVLQKVRAFHKDSFPGYVARRGANPNAAGTFPLHSPATFIFVRQDALHIPRLPKRRKKRRPRRSVGEPADSCRRANGSGVVTSAGAAASLLEKLKVSLEHQRSHVPSGPIGTKCWMAVTAVAADPAVDSQQMKDPQQQRVDVIDSPRPTVWAAHTCSQQQGAEVVNNPISELPEQRQVLANVLISEVPEATSHHSEQHVLVNIPVSGVPNPAISAAVFRNQYYFNNKPLIFATDDCPDQQHKYGEPSLGPRPPAASRSLICRFFACFMTIINILRCHSPPSWEETVP